MNEITIFYWIGYFTATGVILCIGLFAWAMFLNLIHDLMGRTLKTFEGIYITALATKYLRQGKIKDVNNRWWKITVSEDKKKITLEQEEVSEW